MTAGKISKKRADGRPRGVHDKAYARLILEGWNGSPGIDPDDPDIRTKLTALFKLRAPQMPDEMRDLLIKEAIADAKWAKDGFPTT